MMLMMISPRAGRMDAMPNLAPLVGRPDIGKKERVPCLKGSAEGSVGEVSK